MNKIFLVLFLTTQVLISIAQNASGTGATDSTNIYVTSLKHYINKYTSKDASLLVEENMLFTEFFPSNLNGRKVDCINNTEIKRRVKNKKAVIVLRIIPLQFEKGEFFVDIIPFKVSINDNVLKFENPGGDAVVFHYNCETQQFKFIRIAPGGI